MNGLAKSGNGTAWNPVAKVGTDVIYLQCPGACGHVWKINIEDKDIAAWMVNEINQRRHFAEPR